LPNHGYKAQRNFVSPCAIYIVGRKFPALWQKATRAMRRILRPGSSRIEQNFRATTLWQSKASRFHCEKVALKVPFRSIESVVAGWAINLLPLPSQYRLRPRLAAINFTSVYLIPSRNINRHALAYAKIMAKPSSGQLKFMANADNLTWTGEGIFCFQFSCELLRWKHYSHRCRFKVNILLALSTIKKRTNFMAQKE